MCIYIKTKCINHFLDWVKMDPEYFFRYIYISKSRGLVKVDPKKLSNF